MEPLIKITSEPMRIVRFSQNARLVNPDSVDMERRKALARQASFRSSIGQGTASVEDIKKINHAFSKKNVSVQTSDASKPQVVSRQAQMQVQPQPQASSAPVSVPSQDLSSAAADSAVSEAVAAVSSTAASPSVPRRDISVETSSSYTAQRGSFEMRVAKGELTYLPPLMMTIVTQRPQVHIEYLGDFNYVPPRDGDSGGNINLFT